MKKSQDFYVLWNTLYIKEDAESKKKNPRGFELSTTWTYSQDVSANISHKQLTLVDEIEMLLKALI